MFLCQIISGVPDLRPPGTGHVGGGRRLPSHLRGPQPFPHGESLFVLQQPTRLPSGEELKLVDVIKIEFFKSRTIEPIVSNCLDDHKHRIDKPMTMEFNSLFNC